ncbi:T9SS type A sorting domain-containing protein [Flavobacterium psychroterrae]|uniref:T9SS type A sorting domain-containing protein n=1 Tax=Flavobacterium psychroterrae TaxID=2133767 RepID=A0ABS5P867_9FLAO|nr:T9SS type A sorting domain-containing protein [Flavobacterium psychroterrae]MBS7230508.1 T9SS type A sorting domain-containing protein [Flavobacterium psychroterrae]
MKKIYFLVLALCFFNGVIAQNIIIPDINLKMKLISLNVDINSNFEIEISEALNITFLDLSNSNIGSLKGLENFTNLQYLNCTNNQTFWDIDITKLNNLQYLNLSNNQRITYLYIQNSNLSSLVLQGLNNLTYIDCTGNKNLTSLNISGAVNLTEMWASHNNLSSLNVDGLINIKKLYCQVNQLTALDIDNLISLETLECGGNLLTTLNLKNLTNLKSLSCNYNKLFKLDGSNLAKLTNLECDFNEISDLKLTGLTNLKNLICQANQLTSLDINSLTSLESLWCGVNQFKVLDLNGLTKLVDLRCADNQLTSLDLKGLANITILECFRNQLKTLDLSDLKTINRLRCDQNQLTTLFIKNGSNEKDLNFSQNPDLKYICVDETQTELVQQLVNQYGYTNCNVNSYCSFTSGSNFYTIQGNKKIDADSNGCDALDLNLPSLKFTLFDGTNTANLISATNGNYSISLPAGTHTLTPVLENPTYFSIYPAAINVTFPTQATPLTQDFCIIPNGNHPDLEVVILQIVPARPGFDAVYKIICKNKGNTTQSGSVNLIFNDAVLDFIVANPIVATQTTNNLSWNFANLKPFESAEINFTFKVNTSTIVPPVNNGDILSFKATVSSSNTDETPVDNTFTLNQTVVGSYDPNDKTCLEGSIITPDLIGEYVHYMIRFENTGTYHAENIVVKDMIDLNKFDISTLIPTSSSHAFVTTISGGNKVEFIFEGINLPFDDANNDGYIAFKIKTKPTLKVGDSFTNEANIYFDYNFPILTNKATSKFQTTLGTSDFEFSNYFALYPNPATDILNFNAKQDIEIQSVAIYDILGQLVIAVPNAKSASNIDVSKLKTGNYFIKVKSDKGSSSIKFIKK